MQFFWFPQLALILFLVTQGGCTFFSNLSMGPALLRSPVSVDVKSTFLPLNAPLTANEICQLKLISKDVIRGRDRKEAVDSHWNKNVQCTRFIKTDSDESSRSPQIDVLEDLSDSEILIFVAISGGGSRAASLAAHSISLLEKAFISLQQELGVTSAPPMIRLVDAFSTVSGGSLYTYQVARGKAFIDFVKSHISPTSALSEPSEVPTVNSSNCNLGWPEFDKKDKEDQDFLGAIDNYEKCFFYNVSAGLLA